MGGRHAVYNDLTRTGGRRDDNAARTHAKTIDAAPIALRYVIVFGSRQIFSSPLRTVILQTVDELGGMLEANADGDALRFESDAIAAEKAVDISRRMTRRLDDRP